MDLPPETQLSAFEQAVQHLQQEPPHSDLWDRIPEILQTINKLAEAKLSERQAPLDKLRSAVVAFSKAWAHAWPESLDWSVERCALGDCTEASDLIDCAAAALEEVAKLRISMVEAPHHELPNIASQLASCANDAERCRGRLSAWLLSAAESSPPRLTIPASSTKSEIVIEPEPLNESAPSEPLGSEPFVSITENASANVETIPANTDVDASRQTAVPSPDETTASPVSPVPESTLETAPLLTRPEAVTAELPQSLRSYEVFARHYWLDDERRCVRAPWVESTYSQRLATAALSAWSGQRFGELWWHVRAAEINGVEPFIAPIDVEDCAALELRRPLSGSQSRPERLRQALEDSSLAGRGWLVTIFLEAVCPADQPVNSAVAEQLGTFFQGEVGGDLGRVVSALLLQHTWGTSPLPRIVERLERNDMPVAKAGEQLIVQHSKLVQFIKEHRIAAGGKLIHTHCRDAWNEFFSTHVEPLAQAIRTSPSSALLIAARSWDLEKLIPMAAKLWDEHEEIRKHREALAADGNRMMRVANQLRTQFLEVLRLAGLVQDERQPEQNWAALPYEECTRLIDCDPLGDLLSEGLRRLLAIVLRPGREHTPSSVGGMEVTAEDLWQRPALLPLFERTGHWVKGQFRSDLTVRDMPVAALGIASALCLAPPQKADKAFAQTRALITGKRSDLLTYFIDASLLHLPQQERTRIHEEESQMEGRLDALRQRLESLWAQVDDLAWPGAPDVRQLKDNFKRDIELSRRSDLQRRMPLYEEWIKHLVAYLEEVRRGLVENLRFRLAESGDELWTRGHRFFDAGRFAQVVELLDQRPPPERPQLRLTEWRSQAVRLYDQPLRLLTSAAGDTEDSMWRDLLNLWLRGSRAKSGDQQKMRRLFIDAAVGVEGGSLRECTNDAVHVRLKELRRIFAHYSLEPDFAPQFETLGQTLTILSAPVGAPSRDFPGRLASQASASARDQRIPVILCPGMSSNQREDTLRELQQRGIAGAIIDDLDLVRLLEVGRAKPKGLLALLEIVLEQLPSNKVNPFQTLDGHAITLSMFVGRALQVSELLNSAAHSRLFSGRKLGKSALLKYLELSTTGGYTLANGSTLRVLYLGIGGIDKESNVVEEIIAHMRQVLDFTPNAALPADPGDRLTEHMRAFCDTRSDSLLIILDEADSFVESQIKEHDRRNERVLSYRMMKHINSWQVESGLPRIRFLFSGYRTTHKVWGTWANAGGLLRLGPLEPEHAAALIEGPLARIGIDAHEQAPAIARRCGFQPAVLLRFGACLLRHLMLSYPSRCGPRHVEVVSDHVAQVFNDPEVQDEIRLVTSNNFQRNRSGEIIFYSLLMRLRDLPPGDPLADAPSEVLERIRQIDPDLSWLKAREEDCEAGIQSFLDEFVERHLLATTNRDASKRLYRLRFPHYLPVLTHRSDLENHIASLIASVRAGDLGEDIEPTLLPTYTIRSIDDCRSYKEDIISCIVVTSPWLRGLEHKSRGLPSRLNVNVGEVLAMDSTPPAVITGGTVAIHCRPEHLDAALRGQPYDGHPPLLIGGLDLLRAALRTDSENRQSERLIEIQSLGRLSLRSLLWWFERACNLQFDAANAVFSLHAATSGIPHLVGLIDDSFLQMLGDEGGDVPVTLFNDTMSLTDERLDQVANRLLEGPDHERLTRREAELLIMAAKTAESSPDSTFEPEDALRNDWPTLAELHQLRFLPYGTTPDDAISLRLLIDSGFLARDTSQRHCIHLPPQDCAHRLAARMVGALGSHDH